MHSLGFVAATARPRCNAPGPRTSAACSLAARPSSFFGTRPLRSIAAANTASSHRRCDSGQRRCRTPAATAKDDGNVDAVYAVADPVATDENAPTKPRPMKTDAVRETVADTEIVMETEKNEPEKDPAAGENGMFNDMSRVAVVGTVLAVIAALFQHSWVAEHRDVAMIAVFVLGYAGIIFEELLGFDKTSVSLLMGTGIWVLLMTAAGDASAGHEVHAQLSESIADISEILFFLMGAMTIVEIVDGHEGFRVVTDFINTNSRRILLWTIGIVTFFMSSCLDNLTTTIVMISLLRKLVSDRQERWLFGSVVVVAANSGGAWTVVGDLTTTLLWVNGNLSPVKTMVDLFLPSIASLVATMACFTPTISGEFERPKKKEGDPPPRSQLVFGIGLSALLSVPVFKAITGLPPYLGMMSGLGFLWLATDAIHLGEDRENLRGAAAVKRIDSAGVLFFLGILLAVAGLEKAGILSQVAVALDNTFPSREVVAVVIGLISAVLDNVPLVQATIGMYPLEQVPPDTTLWQLDALCAGIGGSLLIIGSASGVALLGMENVPFGWYARKVAVPALIGFLTAIGVYALQSSIHLEPLLALG